ncbi:hypothetical protein [Pseudofrankia sp. BMG5.37]|uniref:hypothetical protein n=1 Tax=Pseudofrankia sp. BMG5.37 TaxID=3050035 RepID=UPI0028957DB0|nr:hypothetical protein [Pseudofrankia sp. BMG5.37]MDT3446779.1 hypothetical protein [Pseudofrankia sp. BMG5.37]
MISGHHGPDTAWQHGDQLVDRSGTLVVAPYRDQRRNLHVPDRLDRRRDDRVEYLQQRGRVHATRMEPLLGLLLLRARLGHSPPGDDAPEVGSRTAADPEHFTQPLAADHGSSRPRAAHQHPDHDACAQRISPEVVVV